MTVQRFGAALAIVLFVVFIQSCKDMGNVPATPVLIATTFSVTLIPGGQTAVTISGGNPPYTISQQPTANIASATLTNNTNSTSTLTIQASSQNVSGTTSVKVKDTSVQGSPNEIEISIQVSATVISFSGQVQPIFTNRCVNAGCHPGGSAPFPLQTGVSYGRLVNVAATEAPCAGIMRVKPSDADNSALYRRLQGTCGDQMPLGLTPLPQAERDLVRDWINQGALSN